MIQKQAINVEITYGDGSDILVCGDNFSILLMEDPQNLNRSTHGIVRNWQLDLSADEAIALANNLLMKASTIKQMEEELFSMGEEYQ